MLPPYNEFGYLPAGIHICDIGEIVARFGKGSPEREVATRELIDFIAWAISVGVQRIIVNGSYVSSKECPNDVDVVLLPSVEYNEKGLAFREESFAWPFLHILIAADEDELMEWASRHFGADRRLLAKGVVEIKL